MAKRADVIITSGHLLKKRMDSLCGRDAIVVQNTVSADFQSEEKVSHSGDFTIGYIGGLIEGRNLTQLVNAFKMFAESHDDVRLLIAGWGPLKEYVSEEADRNSRTIRYLGKVDYSQVPAILSSLSLSISFVSRLVPNNMYATPNKVFEAASHGVPLLVSDFGELASIVRKWNLGYTTDSERPDAILSSLHDIYRNRESLKEMGMRAKETFMQHLSWERVQDELVRAYDQIPGTR